MILAIDIGTSFLKVAVIDTVGNIIFSEKQAIGLATSKIDGEVNPKLWEEGLNKLISSISKSLICKVEAIVISGNGPTFIPVDLNGNTVGNALLWSDNRSLTVADEITTILGYPLPPNFFLSRAYWFKKERSAEYLKTKYFLSCPEYISYLITKEVYTLLPALGFKEFYWDDEKISKLGLEINKFPEFKSPLDIYGYVNSESKIKGLPESLPVICGGPDFTMSVLGTGSISEGIICDRTGTSEGINFCSNKNLKIDTLRTLPHIVSGMYTIAGLIPKSGNYVLSDQLTTLLEEYKNIILKMEKSGLEITEIRVVGGHAGIEAINKMKAESFPYPIKIYSDGSDLVGNGVLGCVALGKYSSFQDACKYMIREKHCYNV